MTGETVVYLGIGSNMNDPETQIEAAVATIDRLPTTRLLRRSPLYGSKPWGPVEQADYLNMVAEISTQLDPQTLLSRVKLIEKAQGRKPGERWGKRLDSASQTHNSTRKLPFPETVCSIADCKDKRQFPQASGLPATARVSHSRQHFASS